VPRQLARAELARFSSTGNRAKCTKYHCETGPRQTIWKNNSPKGYKSRSLTRFRFELSPPEIQGNDSLQLCSDTYLLRSCDRHAVCFCAERSGAANSSFSRLGCMICIAIAARSHPTERPLVPKLLLGQLWCLSSRSKPTRKIWVIDQRDLIGSGPSPTRFGNKTLLPGRRFS
jgi:hypothetical protein